MNKYYDLEIIFFSSNSVIGKLIQAFTQCKWNHVGVITKREGNIVQVHEALADGLVITTYDLKNLPNDFEIEIKKLKVKMHPLQIEKRANAYFGRPYGYLDLLLIILYRYLKPFKLHKPIYWLTNGNKLICSEFVARLLYDVTYKEVDFQKEYNTKYSLINTSMIYNSMFFIIKRERQKKLIEEF